MNRFRIVADSSCGLLTPDGAYFVSVPLTIRTDTEEFRDDAFLDVNEMVTVLRGTGGRSYSACPNIADWEDAFGERGDVIAFIITGSLSGSYSMACAAKKHCEELDSSRRICVVDKETVHCLGASFIFCQCTSSQEEDVLSIDLNLRGDLDRTVRSIGSSDAVFRKTELLQTSLDFAAAPLSLSVFDCFDSAPCSHR